MTGIDSNKIPRLCYNRNQHGKCYYKFSHTDRSRNNQDGVCNGVGLVQVDSTNTKQQIFGGDKNTGILLTCAPHKVSLQTLT